MVYEPEIPVIPSRKSGVGLKQHSQFFNKSNLLAVVGGGGNDAYNRGQSIQYPSNGNPGAGGGVMIGPGALQMMRKPPVLIGEYIEPSTSRKNLMRQVSGLGMEDPVFRTSKADGSPEHPSNIFDDMSLSDVPEDMRDLVSIASDRTARGNGNNGGIDIECYEYVLNKPYTEPDPELEMLGKQHPEEVNNIMIVELPPPVPSMMMATIAAVPKKSVGPSGTTTTYGAHVKRNYKDSHHNHNNLKVTSSHVIGSGNGGAGIQRVNGGSDVSSPSPITLRASSAHQVLTRRQFTPSSKSSQQNRIGNPSSSQHHPRESQQVHVLRTSHHQSHSLRNRPTSNIKPNSGSMSSKPNLQNQQAQEQQPMNESVNTLQSLDLEGVFGKERIHGVSSSGVTPTGTQASLGHQLNPNEKQKSQYSSQLYQNDSNNIIKNSTCDGHQQRYNPRLGMSKTLSSRVLGRGAHSDLHHRRTLTSTSLHGPASDPALTKFYPPSTPLTSTSEHSHFRPKVATTNEHQSLEVKRASPTFDHKPHQSISRPASHHVSSSSPTGVALGTINNTVHNTNHVGKNYVSVYRVSPPNSSSRNISGAPNCSKSSNPSHQVSSDTIRPTSTAAQCSHRNLQKLSNGTPGPVVKRKVKDGSRRRPLPTLESIFPAGEEDEKQRNQAHCTSSSQTLTSSGISTAKSRLSTTNSEAGTSPTSIKNSKPLNQHPEDYEKSGNSSLNEEHLGNEGANAIKSHEAIVSSPKVASTPDPSSKTQLFSNESLTSQTASVSVESSSPLQQNCRNNKTDSLLHQDKSSPLKSTHGLTSHPSILPKASLTPTITSMSSSSTHSPTLDPLTVSPTKDFDEATKEIVTNKNSGNSVIKNKTKEDGTSALTSQIPTNTSTHKTSSHNGGMMGWASRRFHHHTRAATPSHI